MSVVRLRVASYQDLEPYTVAGLRPESGTLGVYWCKLMCKRKGIENRDDMAFVVAVNN